jgi:hypothetical protein
MWLTALIFVFLAAAGILIYGGVRWRAGTRELRASLEAGRETTPPPSAKVLPAPVERYLKAVLPDGHPPIAAVTLTHEGTFNLGETTPRWSPFTSTQRVVTNHPGFDWDARIHMAPGVNAYVHDAYIGGAGVLQVEALGVIPMVDLRGTPEIAEGELMRFLAETPWYPTRLRSLDWLSIDDNSAKATLRDHGTTVTLAFHFGADGLIDTIHADARSRTAHGISTPTPWEGRFWGYERRNGVVIPTRGEVSWLLPAGPWPYWRGQITNIEFELERS